MQSYVPVNTGSKRCGFFVETSNFPFHLSFAMQNINSHHVHNLEVHKLRYKICFQLNMEPKVLHFIGIWCFAGEVKEKYVVWHIVNALSERVNYQLIIDKSDNKSYLL